MSVLKTYQNSVLGNEKKCAMRVGIGLRVKKGEVESKELKIKVVRVSRMIVFLLGRSRILAFSYEDKADMKDGIACKYKLKLNVMN